MHIHRIHGKTFFGVKLFSMNDLLLLVFGCLWLAKVFFFYFFLFNLCLKRDFHTFHIEMNGQLNNS